MKKKTKISRFEVDFKTRLEQQRTAKNTMRLPKLGYAPYRVYEIKEKKAVSKVTLNGVYGYRCSGRNSKQYGYEVKFFADDWPGLMKGRVWETLKGTEQQPFKNGTTRYFR